MLTPKFHIKSNRKTVTLTIDVPFCTAIDDFDVNINVEDQTFMFHCKPYYLHLRLSCKVAENENKQHSTDGHRISFTYNKLEPDETKITADIMSEQTPKYDEIKMYGFAMRGDCDLENVFIEYGDTFLIDPTDVELIERKKSRFKEESKRFDIEHYLCDLIDEDDTISNIIKMKAPWETTTEKKLTKKELDFLKDIKQIGYDLNVTQLKFCCNSLVDILYGYCYDQRTTDFEGNCESGWTISRISASLCYFDGFLSTKEAVISGFRRSLIYPIYRNFNLSQKVLDDLKCVLKLGEEYIIKCLIHIYDIFNNYHSGGHVINELFICHYIAFLSTKQYKTEWATIVDEIAVKKDDLDLNLPPDEGDAEILKITRELSNVNL